MEGFQILKVFYEFFSNKTLKDLGLFLFLLYIINQISLFSLIPNTYHSLILILGFFFILIGGLRQSINIELSSMNKLSVSKTDISDVGDNSIFRDIKKIKLFWPSNSVGIDIIIHQNIPIIGKIIHFFIKKFNFCVVLSIYYPEKNLLIETNHQNEKGKKVEENHIIIEPLNEDIKQKTTTISSSIRMKKFEDVYSVFFKIHLDDKNKPTKICSIIKFILNLLVITSKKELELNT